MTGAVVVHWRHPEETLGCVASLAGEAIGRVVVVDNGGSPPIAARLAAAAPEAIVVRSDTNRGYAGGANLGLRAALDAGCDPVLLLNDDARVRPGATAAATARLATDARIAAVGPKVLLRDDPHRLWLAWGDVTFRDSLVALRGAGAPDGPPFDTPRDVDWIAGCAMWLRRRALETIGLLDEAFFAYHEEVEWCARARRAAWRIAYEPAAVVLHGGRGSGESRAAVRIRKYFAARNTILFARKHGRPLERLRLAAWLVGTLPLQALRHVADGHLDEVGLKVRGLRDGLAGRTPPFRELGLE